MVADFLCRHIARIGDSLASFCESTDPQFRTWLTPTRGQNQARSVLDLIGECASTNNYVAALLTAEPGQVLARDDFRCEPKNADDARHEIQASCSTLILAIRGFSDEDFERTYPHWRGDLSAELLVVGAYRNMCYHAGQINFIQILSGDLEFHAPSSWY